MERQSGDHAQEGSDDEDGVSRDSNEIHRLHEEDGGSQNENHEDEDQDFEQTGDWYIEETDENDDDDEEDNEIRQRTDKNILDVLKVCLSGHCFPDLPQKLEEISEECGDIVSYKKTTKSLFEQLVLKLEENNDQLYSLHHRVKYLEQECESKDLQIDKMTIAMQEEVDNCHQETGEVLEEMTRKVNSEIHQRQEVERLVLRMQSENSHLKVDSRLLPPFSLLTCLSPLRKP
jgi:hypothetical protein